METLILNFHYFTEYIQHLIVYYLTANGCIATHMGKYLFMCCCCCWRVFHFRDLSSWLLCIYLGSEDVHYDRFTITNTHLHTHTHTHAHKHTLRLTHAHTNSHTHKLTHAQTHTLANTPIHMHTNTHKLMMEVPRPLLHKMPHPLLAMCEWSM